MVFTWGGGASREVVTRDYQGVEITYTVVTLPSGRTTVLVQGHNRRDDAAAVVLLKPNGAAAISTILQPGGGFNRPLGSTVALGVEVRFQAPETASRSASDQIIDVLKSVIRDHVTTKDGKIEAAGATGVRG